MNVPPPSDRLPGFLVALIFLALSVLWVIALNVVAGLIMATLFLSDADGGTPDFEALQPLLSDPLVLSLSALLQTGGLLAIVAALIVLFKRPAGPALGLARSRIVPLAAALVVGLTAGFFAGWLAQLLVQIPGFDSPIFELLNDAILTGSPVSRLLFLGVVVLFAPVVEELIFRGFLWDAMEESWGGTTAWLATSVLFAGYHMVPLHVISIFSTGLLIGWLRKVSGSIWPCILAHFVNNLLSAAFVLVLGADGEMVVTGWQAALGLGISVVAAAAAWRWGRVSGVAGTLVGSAASTGPD